MLKLQKITMRLNQENKKRVYGIAGSTETLGTSNFPIHASKNMSIPYNFHIVDNDFPIKADGILGDDFFLSTNAKIDYYTMTLSFAYNGQFFSYKMFSENPYFFTIEPRCEKILKINSFEVNEDKLILHEEIAQGIFVASALVRPHKQQISIRVLNTTENEVKIQNYIPKYHSLAEFNVIDYDQVKNNVERQKKVISKIQWTNTNKEEKEYLKKLIKRFSDIFHLEDDKLTYTNIGQHTLRLKPNAVPVFRKPYRLPFSQKSEIKKQVQKMIDDGLVEESTSEWSSPVLLVPKKQSSDGTKNYRLVLDYRLLNKELIVDRFPLPNIENILDSLGGAKYFSVLDLAQGYYQYELNPASRPYTAFQTENGHYQLTRLGMGLSSSPGAFSRMMNLALSGLVGDKCFVYLDDIVVFSRDFNEHLRNLSTIFERLRAKNLKLKIEKCHFLQKECTYLGHKITQKGILPDESKFEAVKNYMRPENSDQVKRFVAFANYYRKFIKDFAMICLPLNHLTKKNVKFYWSKECEIAFEKIKNALIRPPILEFPDFSKQFIVYTDASKVGLGVVLCNSNNKPVAYYSRALKTSEMNYPVIDLELLGIVYGCKVLRPYLFGQQFILRCDHRPLVSLFAMKTPSVRRDKFRSYLEEFDFVVEYVKGTHNVVADALSRIYSSELKKLQNISQINVMTRAQTRRQTADTGNNSRQLPTVEPQSFLELLKTPRGTPRVKFTEENIDKYINGRDTIITDKRNVAYLVKERILVIKINRISLEGSWQDAVEQLSKLNKTLKIEKLAILPNEVCQLNNINNKARTLIKKLQNATKIQIILIKDKKLIENDKEKHTIIHDMHVTPTGGHAGITKTSKTIKQYYYWPNLDKDVEEFISTCQKCQINKHYQKSKQNMTKTTTASSSFDKVFLDLVQLPESLEGFKFILTVQDELSKYVIAEPLKSKNAPEVAQKFVEGVILKYGIPKIVASDCGSEFLNEIFRNICILLGVTQINSTPYHHESIGALERSHSVLGAYLRNFLTELKSEWQEWLPFYTFAYNTKVHEATNYTPFELVFGKICNLPVSIFPKDRREISPLYNLDSYFYNLRQKLQMTNLDAKEYLEESKQNRIAKNNNNKKIRIFNKGEKILLRNEERSKLDAVFSGPYIVVEDNHPNLKIEKNNKMIIIHKDRIRPYYQNFKDRIYIIN